MPDEAPVTTTARSGAGSGRLVRRNLAWPRCGATRGGGRRSAAKIGVASAVSQTAVGYSSLPSRPSCTEALLPRPVALAAILLLAAGVGVPAEPAGASAHWYP